jgi:uncharacterized repeat protein (TIGR01451 family)
LPTGISCRHGCLHKLSMPPIHEWICEMTESTETALGKKPLLNRSFWIKVIPVGLFAALGTFAVVQSILGEKNAPVETEQTAGSETGAEAPRALLRQDENSSEGLPSELAASEAERADESAEKESAGEDLNSSELIATKPPVLSDLKLVRAESDGASANPSNAIAAAKPAVPALESVPVTKSPANNSSPNRSGSGAEFKLASGEAAAPSGLASFGDQPKAQPANQFSDSAQPSSNPAMGGDLSSASRAGTPPFGAGMENAGRKSSELSPPSFGGPSGTGVPSASPPEFAGGTTSPSSPVVPTMLPPKENSFGSGAPSSSPPPAVNSLRDVAGSGLAAQANPAAAPPVNSSDTKPPSTLPSGFNGQAGPIGSSSNPSSAFAQGANTAPLSGPPPITSSPSSGGTPPATNGFGDQPPVPTAPLGAGQANGLNRSFGGAPPLPQAGVAAPPAQGGNGLGGALPTVTTPPGNSQPPANALGAAPAAMQVGGAPANYPSSPVGLGNNANLVRDALPNSVAAPAGAGLPGKAELEGEQVPALSIEKVAPREIQVDQPTDFKIVVRNVGRVVANEVRVTDQVPRGAQFVKAVPEANRGANGGLVWELGSLKPGEDRSIVLTLQPKQTGEIGSVAQVTFATPASMRVMVTKPQLAVEHSGPGKVTIGDRVPLAITVRNLGNGPAKDVVLQETVPPQLKFAEDFNELEYEIGTLAPGQSKKVNLNLSAAQIGRFRNTILVSGQGGLHAEHQIDMEVIAPQLTLASEGPNRRYIKRNATHSFSIRNTGTAIATNLDLVAKLPRGVKFVSANNQGQYDPGSNAVYWSLDRLNVAQAASVQLTTTPVEVGEQNIEFIATADLDQKTTFRQPLVVEDLVELFFEIDDVDDVIEVGSETRYRVRLMNQGTVVATNIQLTFSAEQGIRPVSVDNRLTGEVRGQEVVFAPIAEIRPGEVLETFITATAVSPGEHRVVARLRADQREMNVSKEESTRVYADR